MLEKISMLAKILFLLSCLLALPVASIEAQSGIQVSIDGLRTNKGQVICSLYSSAEGFPKNESRAVARSTSVIADGQGNCTFSDIQPGTYAISVFHDENLNGRLDTNFLGIPREGVGASNNARGHFGPPTFRDASFEYPGGEMDLRIRITYL